MTAIATATAQRPPTDPAAQLPRDPRGAGDGGAAEERDSLGVIALYGTLLVLVPSVYVVGPLGAAGTPATLVALAGLGLWVLRRLLMPSPSSGGPVHRATWLFGVAMTTAFVAGTLRPMSGAEFTSSWRGVITVLSWVGVVLVVADGIRTKDRLQTLLRVILLLGFVLALLGVVQFATQIDFVSLIHPPGLTQNSPSGGIYERSGFSRVSGTAIHSIEFSAVLAMVLPVGFSVAVRARTRAWWPWLQVLTIVVALPMTVARSGMLGLALALVAGFVMMRRRQRRLMVLLVPLGAVAFRAAVPGLLGTIVSLFAGASEDQSIAGRTGDYTAVDTFFHQAPWFGRGIFTFLPSIYRTLDNQYLGVLIEAGLLGLVAFLLFGVVPAAAAFRRWWQLNRAARATSDLELSDTAVTAFGLGAASTIGVLLSATFDSFGFPMCMGIFCLLIGAVGALWRLIRAEAPAPRRSPRRHRPRAGSRVLVSAGVAMAVLAPGGLALATAKPGYDAQTSLALAVPPQDGQNIYYGKREIPGVSDLVRYVLDSAQVRAELAAAGSGDYTVALGRGSLGELTEVVGSGDVVRISGRGPTVAAAQQAARAVAGRLASELVDLQQGDVPADVRVAVVDAQPIEVFEVPTHRTTAALGLVVLTALVVGPAATWTGGTQTRGPRATARS